MQSTEWRPIPGYEGLYEVSSAGQIKRTGSGHGATPGRILRQRVHANGYLHVGLRDAQRCRRVVTVHSLVLSAFESPRPSGMEGRHLDGNRLNNDASNLRWGTHSENVRDSVNHGTHYSHRRTLTTCPNGHTYTAADNTKNGRSCHVCARAKRQRYLTRLENR